MGAFLKWLLLLPLAVIAVGFAVANRHWVEIGVDPTGMIAPGLTFRAPLFAALVLAVMTGVVIGSAATWLAQGRHRKAARVARAQAQEMKISQEQAREEADRLRAQIASLPAPGPGREAA